MELILTKRFAQMKKQLLLDLVSLDGLTKKDAIPAAIELLEQGVHGEEE